MDVALLHRIDRQARRLVPAGLTFLLVLAGALYWPAPGLAPVSPVLAMPAVYFWTLHRPAMMTPVAVFVLGLTQDVLSGGPLGLNALVLVALHAVLTAQRKLFASKPFLVLWAGFAALAAALGVLGWCLASLYYLSLLRPEGALVQVLVDVAAYPVLSYVFSGADQALLRTA